MSALQPRFSDLLREAIQHFSAAGYTSELELQEWTVRLHTALEREMPGHEETKKLVGDFLTAIYAKDIQKMGILRRVPGVTKYTIDRIAPSLRAELDRKIYTAVDLIKLNATERKQQTLRRFAGWVSSVPRGGSASTDLREVAREIAKPSKQVKFEARRVAIDQGHKLSAAVAHVVAHGEGAIAAIWHDRGEKDHGYDARPAHLARSGKLFLIRDSWAIEQGLIKKGALPYTDEFEDVAQLPFCSCFYEFIVSPNRLPEAVLTAKGRMWVRGNAA